MDAACRRLNTILVRRQLGAGQREVAQLALPALGGGIRLPLIDALRVVAMAPEQITSPWLRHFGNVM
jgi:hypothetical protein